MSKRRKPLERIKNNPANVTLTDLQALLEDFGFTLHRSSGSHHIFKVEINGKLTTLVIPFARPLKAVYVKEALSLISQIEQASKSEDGE